MSERIDAPGRILDTVKQAQDTMQKLQMEVQAILFGASAALDVPDGWVWDGSGWVKPVEGQAIEGLE